MFISCSVCFARIDTRSYLGDIDTPAVWVEPKNIKVYIYPDQDKKYILERSFKTWDSALGSDLNFKFVNDPTSADITIKYVDRLTENAAGITKPQYIRIQGKVYLAKADVLIGYNTPGGWKMNDAELNNTVLHEIGHAIGILGHSENINDIMYYSLASTRQGTLSAKDVETVNKIYGF